MCVCVCVHNSLKHFDFLKFHLSFPPWSCEAIRVDFLHGPVSFSIGLVSAFDITLSSFFKRSFEREKKRKELTARRSLRVYLSLSLVGNIWRRRRKKKYIYIKSESEVIWVGPLDYITPDRSTDIRFSLFIRQYCPRRKSTDPPIVCLFISFFPPPIFFPSSTDKCCWCDFLL